LLYLSIDPKGLCPFTWAKVNLTNAQLACLRQTSHSTNSTKEPMNHWQRFPQHPTPKPPPPKKNPKRKISLVHVKIQVRLNTLWPPKPYLVLPSGLYKTSKRSHWEHIMIVTEVGNANAICQQPVIPSRIRHWPYIWFK